MHLKSGKIYSKILGNLIHLPVVCKIDQFEFICTICMITSIKLFPVRIVDLFKCYP